MSLSLPFPTYLRVSPAVGHENSPQVCSTHRLDALSLPPALSLTPALPLGAG